jgi:hypothetical protein
MAPTCWRRRHHARGTRSGSMVDAPRADPPNARTVVHHPLPRDTVLEPRTPTHVPRPGARATGGAQKHHPRHHVPRAGAHVDEEGFTLVESRRRARTMHHRPVPSALVGLCFNYMAGDHVAADCRFPSRCLHCRGKGHRARDCKHSRSPSWHVTSVCAAPRPRMQSWVRSRAASGGDGGSEGAIGGVPEPQLGPRWGPTFRQAPPALVGSIPCPVANGNGRWSSGTVGGSSY